jgi:hypothetical protein
MFALLNYNQQQVLHYNVSATPQCGMGKSQCANKSGHWTRLILRWWRIIAIWNGPTVGPEMSVAQPHILVFLSWTVRNWITELTRHGLVSHHGASAAVAERERSLVSQSFGIDPPNMHESEDPFPANCDCLTVIESVQEEEYNSAEEKGYARDLHPIWSPAHTLYHLSSIAFLQLALRRRRPN